MLPWVSECPRRSSCTLGAPRAHTLSRGHGAETSPLRQQVAFPGFLSHDADWMSVADLVP